MKKFSNRSVLQKILMASVPIYLALIISDYYLHDYLHSKNFAQLIKNQSEALEHRVDSDFKNLLAKIKDLAIITSNNEIVIREVLAGTFDNLQFQTAFSSVANEFAETNLANKLHFAIYNNSHNLIYHSLMDSVKIQSNNPISKMLPQNTLPKAFYAYRDSSISAIGYSAVVHNKEKLGYVLVFAEPYQTVTAKKDHIIASNLICLIDTAAMKKVYPELPQKARYANFLIDHGDAELPHIDFPLDSSSAMNSFLNDSIIKVIQDNFCTVYYPVHFSENVIIGLAVYHADYSELAGFINTNFTVSLAVLAILTAAIFLLMFLVLRYEFITPMKKIRNSLDEFVAGSRGLIKYLSDDIKDHTEFASKNEARLFSHSLQEFTKSTDMLLNSINDGLLLFDMHGKLFEVNNNALKMLNLDRTVLSNYTIEDFLKTDIHRISTAAILETLQNQIKHSVHILRNDLYSGKKLLMELIITKTAFMGKTVFVANIRDITQTKNLLDNLQENEELYHLLADNIQDVIWTLDINGKFLYISPSVQRLLGFSPSEIIGANANKIMTAESAALCLRQINDFTNKFQQSAGNSNSRRFRLQMTEKSGNLLTAEAIITAITDDSGKLTAFNGIVRDISDIVEKEVNLELNSRILESVGDSIFLHDSKGDIIFTNSAAYLTRGYTKNEILQLNVKDIDARDSEQYVKVQMQKLFALKHISFETTHKHKNGTTFPVWVKATTLTVKGQTLILSVVRDISNNKIYEKELQQSKEKYQKLIEASPDAIIVLNCQGIITYISPRVLTIFGYDSEDEILGKSPLKWIADDDKAQAAKNLQALLQGQSLGNNVYKLINSKNEVFFGEIMSSPLYDSEKKIAGIISVIRDITQRIMTEEALKTSEQRYKMLLENANDAIFLADGKSGMLIDANKRAQALIGRPLSEIQKMHQSELHPVERREFYANRFKQGTDDARFVANAEVLHKNGQIIPVDISAAGFILDGKPVIMGIFRDITELRLSERALMKSEKELEINNRISNIFLTSDENAIFSDVLNVILQLFDSRFGFVGYIDDNGDYVSPSLTRDVWEECNVKDKNIVFRKENWTGLWGKALIEKKTQMANSGLHVPKGHIEITRSVCSPILYKDELLGLICIGNRHTDYNGDDIEQLESIAQYIAPILSAKLKQLTGEKQKQAAQQALKKSKENLSLIFEAAPIPLLIASTDNDKVILANRAVSDFLKIPKDSFSKLNINDIFSDEDYAQLMQIPEQNSTFINHEAVIIDFEYKKHWVIISAYPISYNNENALIIGFTDISERKQYLEEIENAKNIAESASRAKSEFLANMSHEIRTPMNSILGFTELLMEKNEDSENKTYLKNILRSGKTLMTLINDILDLSKIESGKIELHHDVIDFTVMLRDIRNIFSIKVKEKNLNFILQIQPGLPKFFIIDEVRLRQILFNLVGNAVKFTESGFIKIKTAFAKKDAQFFDLTINVEDSGIGIPPEQIEVIFDAFVQQSGQSTKKYGGTGLGLAITKKLANLMGGSVQVHSSPGDGSVFTVFIPNVQAANEQDGKITASVRVPSNLNLRGVKLLCADDNAENRQLIYALLEKSKANIIQSSSGTEALELAAQHKPDIILLDLHMPEFSGYDTAKELRRQKEFRKTPLIAITADVNDEAKTMAFDAGFDAFLNKPVTKDQLNNCLLQFIPDAEEEEQPSLSRERFTDFNPDFFDNFYIEKNADLKAILSDLEQNVLPLYQSILKSSLVHEILSFSVLLSETGEKYNLRILSEFGEMLKEYTQIFDFDNISKSLKYFPNILNRISDGFK